MDNGAYAAYRAENPSTNIFITTYEKVAFFPEELKAEELIILVFFISISIYALFQICKKIISKPTNFEKIK
jgi:hypothetical protein